MFEMHLSAVYPHLSRVQNQCGRHTTLASEWLIYLSTVKLKFLGSFNLAIYIFILLYIFLWRGENVYYCENI